jgi:hypothetical protein
VILDPNILADLAVAITPKSYVRVTPMAHAGTPLGAGFGVTRFASPTKAFKVIYLGQDLTTGVAETLVRDRFQGRARRKLLDVEAALWGATEVDASAPLTLIDLRTTGLVRLGVSTEAARGKAQGQGRRHPEQNCPLRHEDGFISHRRTWFTLSNIGRRAARCSLGSRNSRLKALQERCGCCQGDCLTTG